MVFALGFEGVGARLRGRVRSPAATAVDGVLGAVLTAVRRARDRVGARRVGAGQRRRGAPRGAALDDPAAAQHGAAAVRAGCSTALARLDPFPRIDGPEARVPAPTAGIARAGGVRAAADSVVKILGNACGLGVEGSGWVAGDGLVVTNAHVVAGQKDTRVLLRGRQPGLDAAAVVVRSAATISRCCGCPGLKAPALTLVGEAADRHLGGDPRLPGQRAVRRARRAASAQTREVITQDAYGQGPVRRSITSLRGAVRSGNSGGPMVDADGQVVTTVFAATTSGPRGGFGVPNAIVRAALERARGFAAACPLVPGRVAPLPSRARNGQDARHRREAVRRPGPDQGPPRRVRQARGLPRVRHARRHVGGRAPRAARRARRVRRQVQEVAHGRSADRAGPLQARRARRALAQADDRHHAHAQARRRRPRSSTPATPAARAS